MAATYLGEIDHFVPEGIVTQSFGELPDTLMPCGIVIKCVGFLTNKANETILQRKDTRASGLVDENLWVVLEAHLDAGFFSLPFGSSYAAQAFYTASCIAKGYAEPDSMVKMLRTPINSTISHFTAGDLFDSMMAIQKELPEMTAMLHKGVQQTTARFNGALDFSSYLDRNEVMWAEYHEMLFPRSPVPNARAVKGPLPWPFRGLENLVNDEWAAFRAEEASRQEAATALSAPKPWEATPEAQRDVAILFPGQGTQKVGMAAKLLDSGSTLPCKPATHAPSARPAHASPHALCGYAAPPCPPPCPPPAHRLPPTSPHPPRAAAAADKTVEAMFETASKVLGYSLTELIANGPQEKLDTTLYSQPAIFVCSLAAMELAKKESPEMLKKIKTAAGFSLGEYSALVYAGGLSYEDGLKVVKARAEAMDAAAKAAASGMASIGGLPDDKLMAALDEAAVAVGKGKAYVANYMFPQGRTCSGDLDVLAKACELAKAKGAKNANMLAVSGAFHTPYMTAAGAALSKVLDEADIQMPSIHVYSNVTGKPYTSVDEIKALLKRQLLEPVKWEQGTNDLIALGHAQYVEPGPGKQLKAMMRRICPDAW